jgi:HSP20 family protein
MLENLPRKDPLRELRDATDRFLQERLAAMQGSEAVAIDIYETGDAVVVMTTIIGVTPEDIDVSITDDRLTIKGESRLEAEVEESAYLRRERRFGKFSRTILIPRAIKPKEASAAYKNGVLTITIPKVEEARAKKIEIKTE